jgi:hypothetical protein
MQRDIIRPRKRWLIIMLGLLGIVVSWQSCRWMNSRTSGIDLPDYAANLMQVDWNGYTQIGREVSELTKQWLPAKSMVAGAEFGWFEQKISEESLSAQTTQIKQFFTEEESFRKADLEKDLDMYRNQLNLEMVQELDVETIRLKTRYQREFNRRERDIKDAITKYNDELLAGYQVTLANLQLQLLLVDLSNRINDPAVEKRKIQDQIDKIHQEMNDKLTSRQRQLSEELAQYKKQHQTALDLEIAGIRDRLAKSAESAISKYRNLLETDFNQWRQQRQQDIQMVINLRQSRL